MSPSTTDRKIIRTKQMLRDALLDVMEDKGFEAVTVRNLTEKANLNRGTFYLHFLDIADMIAKYKDEIFQEMKQISMKFNPHDMIDVRPVDEPPPNTVQIFEFMAGHARFLKLMLGPKGDPSFPLYMKQIMKENFYEKLSLLHPNQADMLVPPDYLATYVISANLGIIQYWFETDMALSPMEMAMLSLQLSRLGPLQSSVLLKPQVSANT